MAGLLRSGPTGDHDCRSPARRPDAAIGPHRNRHFKDRHLSHRPIGILAILFALCAQPASGADVIFPTASRIGLVPAAGMTPSRAFPGFEDAGRKVVFLFAELPAHAYPDTLKSMRESGRSMPGVSEIKREVLLTKSGAAHMISGDQTVNDAPSRKWILVTWNSNYDFAAMVTAIVPKDAAADYPDARVREILASLSLRGDVPNDEVLSSLPFRVAETGAFKFARPVSVGRAVLLTDAEQSLSETLSQPQILVSIAPVAPVEAPDRPRFSQQLLTNLPGLKDVQMTFSEPLRIAGLPAHEIRLSGKDAKTGTAVTVVQWVRFGGGHIVRLVGLSPNDQWTDSFARFRRIRDGLEFR